MLGTSNSVLGFYDLLETVVVDYTSYKMHLERTSNFNECQTLDFGGLQCIFKVCHLIFALVRD